MKYTYLKHASVFLLLILQAGLLVAAPPPSIESFIKPELIQPGSMRLSPNGDYYSLIVPREDRSSLIIVERATNKVTANITPNAKTFIDEVWWVSDKRVIYSMNEKFGGYARPFSTGELFGIDADGKNNKYLFGYRGNQQAGSNINHATAMEASAIVLESEADSRRNILIAVRPWNVTGESQYMDIMRMHIVDGSLVKAGTRIPLRYLNYELTDNELKLRVVEGSKADRFSKTLYRDADNNWQLLNDQEVSGRAVYPLQFNRAGDAFYAQVSEPGKMDYLILFNPLTKTEKVILQPMDADIGEVMLTADRKDIYAVKTFEGAGRGGFAFIDKEAPETALLKALNAQFQGELANITGFSKDGRFASVYVTSDVNPGEYYILDKDNKKMSAPMRVRPEININETAVVEPIEFTSRDGLKIHAWLTVPNEPKGKMPLVVMPHGGPYGVVDRWEFNKDAQLLASRGYAVLQINFRGSGGYGKSFADAGAAQWGAKMQTDITDGTRAALSKFAIDANRVCIYGISYGAYAALMGVATEPGLFKCAIGYSGVYDLNILKTAGDVNDSAWGRTYLDDVLQSDASELTRRSPTQLAGQIKAPVLLIHGGADERAPPLHAEKMQRALTAAGNAPVWVFEEAEGHYFFDLKHNLNAYQHMLDFLDKHIGANAK